MQICIFGCQIVIVNRTWKTFSTALSFFPFFLELSHVFAFVSLKCILKFSSNGDVSSVTSFLINTSYCAPPPPLKEETILNRMQKHEIFLKANKMSKRQTWYWE